MKAQFLHSHLLLLLLFGHVLADSPPSLSTVYDASKPFVKRGRNARRQTPSNFENYAMAYQTNVCDNWSSDYVQQVQAQWIVPSVSVPPSASGAGEWWMYQAVAVDGLGECPAAMAVGGVATSIQVDDAGASKIQAYGFYQYLPDPINLFTVPISIGDSVQMTINTFGYPPLYTIVNLSTNQTQSIRISTNQVAICSKTASFLIADPGPVADLSSFAAFEDFTLSSCDVQFYANDCNLDGANFVPMYQNGTELATASFQTSTDLLFHYG